MVNVSEALLKSINGMLGGALDGVSYENATLPRDRYAEYVPRTRTIRVDEARAKHKRGGVTESIVHEIAHHLTPHLTTPDVWHNREFEKARGGLMLDLWVAEQRYAKRYGPKKARKEPNMLLVRTGPGGQPDARALLAALAGERTGLRSHTPEGETPFAAAQRRAIQEWPEYRRGARSVEQRRQPPHDARGGSDLVERRLRFMRDRASTW